MIVEFQVDAEALDEFDVYCITSKQSRNAVMGELIADYIRRK
jgi:hypothetical protein